MWEKNSYLCASEDTDEELKISCLLLSKYIKGITGNREIEVQVYQIL